MSHPGRLFAAFLFCLAILLGAMGWTTWTVVQLDRSQAQSQREAERIEAEMRRQEFVDQRVRLALWRMDAALGQLLLSEINRPYFAYQPPAAPGNSKKGTTASTPPAEIIDTPGVVLHFQFGPDGELTSPESGSPPLGQRLEEFAAKVARPKLLEACPAGDVGDRVLLVQSQTHDSPVALDGGQPPSHERQVLAEDSRIDQNAQLRRQQAVYSRNAQQINELELGNRSRAFQQPLVDNTASLNWMMSCNLSGTGTAVRQGLVRPVWIGETLVLARRVMINKQEYIQGSWLDWPTVKKKLTAGIADLLPAADLVPGQEVAACDQWRLLATAPILLVPGAISDSLLREAGWIGPPEGIAQSALGANELFGATAWPLWASLSLAWAAVLVAAVAVALLLWAAISLSERRAAFVSAVTHELRTPLTTFRLYADLLRQGMVTEPARQKEYLATLQSEADRLSHLVENVLAYARLERRAEGGRIGAVPLAQLTSLAADRLTARAAQAGMDLQIDSNAEPKSAQVHADPAAVEQILFNLIDNACKYAGGAADRRIHLEMTADDQNVTLRVRDHGPGVARRAVRRQFRPFSRVPSTANALAPGIGLGLALSRRLARGIGGELRCCPDNDGACFELILRRAA
jgi:signal transduction histidine kinase